jgi:hypothetical protein
MHARLVIKLALATLLCAPACGSQERGAADPVSGVNDVAAEAAGAENGVEIPDPERHDALPASFPQDIKIPQGLLAVSVESASAGSYVALFTGDLDPEVVYAFFSEHLASEGWRIDKAHGAGAELGIFASKGARIATVIATRIDGRLHVELGVSGGS